MMTWPKAALAVALAGCVSPPGGPAAHPPCRCPKPGAAPELSVLIEAHQTLAETSDHPDDALRESIRARCGNLIDGHRIGYRARFEGGRRMEAGNLDRTDRLLDLALDGQGFFQWLRYDNTPVYSRVGQLQRDRQGNLVSFQGLLLNPPLTIPENITAVLIDVTGLVQGLDPTMPEALQMIGQLQIVRFANPEKLMSEDGVLFRECADSGAALVGVPGHGGFGLVRQGYLEQSNVDRVREVCALAAEVRQYRLAVEAWRLKQKLR